MHQAVINFAGVSDFGLEGIDVYHKGLGGSVLREGCLRVVVPHYDSAFDGDRVDTN